MLDAGKVKKRGLSPRISWKGDNCEPEAQILLKSTKTNKGDILIDTLDIMPIKCITPTSSFILNNYTSLKNMVISKELLMSYPVNLIFDQNGNPN